VSKGKDDLTGDEDLQLDDDGLESDYC